MSREPEDTTGTLFKLDPEQQGSKVKGSVTRWILPFGTTVKGNVEGTVTR
jgi:hypothetical protein